MRRIVTVEEQTAGMKQHKTGFMFALLRDREIRRANARNWRRNDIDKFIRRRISVLCHVSFVALRQRCVKNGTCPCCTHTSYILIILYRSTDFVITLPLRTPSLLFPFKFLLFAKKVHRFERECIHLPVNLHQLLTFFWLRNTIVHKKMKVNEGTNHPIVLEFIVNTLIFDSLNWTSFWLWSLFHQWQVDSVGRRRNRSLCRIVLPALWFPRPSVCLRIKLEDQLWLTSVGADLSPLAASLTGTDCRSAFVPSPGDSDGFLDKKNTTREKTRKFLIFRPDRVSKHDHFKRI